MYILPVVFLSFLGFLISFYIFQKKRSKTHLKCPLDAQCDQVIHSKFSSFFGISVEVLGMIYYGLVAVGYGLKWYLPSFFIGWVGVILPSITIGAVLFSLYLVFVQIFTLKEYCSWCIASAFICVLIAVLALAAGTETLVPFLSEHNRVLLIFHIIGLALGVGGATITDVFFFRFLKDYKISHKEADVLDTVSEVVWAGLAILILSGLGLYLPSADQLTQNPRFLTKMTVVAIITLNGAVLNLKIRPHLMQIEFGKHEHQEGEMVFHRRLSFALGAVSFVSWYSALFFGLARGLPDSFWVQFGGYLVVIAVAVGVSQIIERRLKRSANQKK
ncbi:MAG: vitamin K epoxide reductase family protein [Candidatus Paceibacteria bacterium]